MKGWLLLTAWLFMGADAVPEEGICLQPFGEAMMNWSTLQMHTRSRGEPGREAEALPVVRNRAWKGAEQEGYRVLQDALEMIPVTERETIGMLNERDAGFQRVLTRQVRQFALEEVTYYSNGAVEMELSLRLAPIFAHAVGATKGAPALSPVSKKKSGTYTGLIVNAQGIVFYPVIRPVLLAEDNLVIYSRDKVKGDAVFQHGIVAYYTSLERAKKDERIGKNPFIVNALQADSRDSLIVSSQLQRSNVNLEFLEEGRVVIVVTQPRFVR